MALIANAISAFAFLVLGFDDTVGEPASSADDLSNDAQTASRFNNSGITAVSGPSRCAFTEVPVEIRDRIYEYYFELEPANDLLSRKQPGMSLILTCKRIRGEAKEISRAARSSWPQQEFIIKLPANFPDSEERIPIYSAILDLEEDKIKCITNLMICGKRAKVKLSAKGLWFKTGWAGPTPRRELWRGVVYVPLELENKIVDAGYELLTRETCAPAWILYAETIGAEELVAAKELMGGVSLTREELIWAVMDVGEDCKGPYELV